MQYAKLITPTREALIAVESTGWGLPYQKLFDQTDVSGNEVFLLESSNNFNNPFQQASEQRYKQKGYWAELFRDIVRDGGKGTDEKGRLNINYISHAGTEFERKHNVWAPKNGYWVPTQDGIFHEGTLVPFETVLDRKEAVRRIEAAGMPKEQTSYFYRLDGYDSDRFVGRDFDPDFDDDGRFDVDLDGHPSNSGSDGVASRPKFGAPELLMEVNAVPQATKQY